MSQKKLSSEWSPSPSRVSQLSKYMGERAAFMRDKLGLDDPKDCPQCERTLTVGDFTKPIANRRWVTIDVCIQCWDANKAAKAKASKVAAGKALQNMAERKKAIRSQQIKDGLSGKYR